jgi:hypothetical protein
MGLKKHGNTQLYEISSTKNSHLYLAQVISPRLRVVTIHRDHELLKRLLCTTLVVFSSLGCARRSWDVHNYVVDGICFDSMFGKAETIRLMESVFHLEYEVSKGLMSGIICLE